MSPGSQTIGESLRRLRLERQLSLSGVAAQAGVSVATLSRVETGKQTVDVVLLLTIARILGVAPSEILGSDQPGDELDELTRRISRLPAADRGKVFSESSRRRTTRDVSATMDDLLAQIDLLRDDLLELQRRVRTRKR
jgi:transcriptional regulator with XRE-family HTH domain